MGQFKGRANCPSYLYMTSASALRSLSSVALSSAPAGKTTPSKSDTAAAPSVRMLNLRQEFPTQWHRFLHPATPDETNSFELEMAPNFFPLRYAKKTLKVTKIWLQAICSSQGELKLELTVPTLDEPIPITLKKGNDKFGNLHYGDAPSYIEIEPIGSNVKWKLGPPAGGTWPAAQLEDLFLVIGYMESEAQNDSTSLLIWITG